MVCVLLISTLRRIESSLDLQHPYINLHINNANIVDINELLTADDITIKIRGIGVNPEQPVSIERWEDGFMRHTPDAAYAPAKGQPLVFYRGERVIGGGIVVGFN